MNISDYKNQTKLLVAGKQLFLATAFTLFVSGCATIPTVATAPPGSKLNANDIAFLTSAWQLMEFNLAECDVITAKQGFSSRVRQVAAKTCADANHYKPMLAAIASQNNVTLPETLSYELSTQLQDLQSNYQVITLNAGTIETDQPRMDVNTLYLTDQIGSHRASLAVFDAEAKAGSTPELRSFAAKTAPIVQSNLTLLLEAEKLS